MSFTIISIHQTMFNFQFNYQIFELLKKNIIESIADNILNFLIEHIKILIGKYRYSD